MMKYHGEHGDGPHGASITVLCILPLGRPGDPAALKLLWVPSVLLVSGGILSWADPQTTLVLMPSYHGQLSVGLACNSQDYPFLVSTGQVWFEFSFL